MNDQDRFDIVTLAALSGIVAAVVLHFAGMRQLAGVFIGVTYLATIFAWLMFVEKYDN